MSFNVTFGFLSLFYVSIIDFGFVVTTRFLYSCIYIYIYIYMYVCMCVSVMGMYVVVQSADLLRSNAFSALQLYSPLLDPCLDIIFYIFLFCGNP